VNFKQTPQGHVHALEKFISLGDILRFFTTLKHLPLSLKGQSFKQESNFKYDFTITSVLSLKRWYTLNIYDQRDADAYMGGIQFRIQIPLQKFETSQKIILEYLYSNVAWRGLKSLETGP